MSWKPDRLLKVILTLTAITMITVWLPFIRGSMDGNTYEWGNSFLGFGFGGQGIGGYYWIVVLEAVLCVAVIYFGWRGAQPPFHWLLLLWNIPQAVDAFYNAIRFPENYRFQGDTLGVDLSLAWVGPLLFGGLALLSLIWVVRDLRQRRSEDLPVWSRRNRVLLMITFSLLPLQFFLLRFGEPHGTTDQIGVILTMLQWALLNITFAARPSEKALRREAIA